jgi:hypothetical protein
MLAERSDDIEWGTPVLFMRVPDGRIFDLGEGRQLGVPTPPDPTALALASGPRTTRTARAAPDPRPAARSRHALSIFVNYRRDDTSGHALLLTDRLSQHFGAENVHSGVDHGPGADRLEQIQDTDGVLLTLIGPGWGSSLKAAAVARHGHDFARRELELALRDIPERVIPVVIDAPMPDPATLPRSLRALRRRESTTLQHASFDHDLAALISRLERAASEATASPAPRRDRTPVAAEARPVTPGPRRTQVAAGVPQPYEDHYVEIIKAMLEGTVVPLLGAGVRGASPTTDHLAEPLAERFETKPSGLAAVAQQVAVTRGERRLHAAIKDLVVAESSPTEVELFLSEFPGILRQLGLRPAHQLIVSANYDTGLERAFEDANEPFDYAVYKADSGRFVHVPWGEQAWEPSATTVLEPRRYVDFPIDDEGQLERTIIVKINGGPDGSEGGVAWRNNYVVTEDDYIDYLPTHNVQDHIPIQILDKLAGSRCLFLGYVLRNWNARVFLRRIWRGNPISENSWAIEDEPDLLEKASWSAVGRVELLTAALPDYVTELRSMLLGRQGSQ